MSTPSAPGPPAGTMPATQPVAGARSCIPRMAARRSIRSVLVWAYGFAAYVVGSISGFALAYKTPAARHALAASLGSNAGLAAILGPARHIDTVAGFAAWRTVGILGLAGAVWGLLASTRLLRGEEESGRAELQLCGSATLARFTAQGLAGLGAGCCVLFAVTAAVAVGDGWAVHPALPSGATAYLALTLSASAAMFIAIGALTSQLAPTRRRAAGLAAAVLGASFVIRAIADAGAHRQWLLWASPLGWLEELRPLTGSHAFALLPIAAFVAVTTLIALRLARRDLGSAVLQGSDAGPARTTLLGSPLGLAARLLYPVSLAWIAGTAGLCLLEGSIAKAASASIAGSPGVANALRRLGAATAGRQSASSFLALAFLTVAVVLALQASGQVASNREEEATGRLEAVAVHPVSLRRWLAGRFAAEVAILVASGVAAGLASWAGAAPSHSGVGFASIVAGGINIVPPAIFVLGAGTALYGLAPRLAAPACYGLVGWGFLLEFVGSVARLSHWIMDTSVFSHLAAVPVSGTNWASAAGLVALGAAGAFVGVIALQRRDLIGS